MWPQRVGRTRAAGGPTWKVANGPGWERTAKGVYVPTSRRPTVEQRIVDAASRLPFDGSRGCVTGWAALRWQGASYFDGRTANGTDLVPVELALPGPGGVRSDELVVARRRWLPPAEHEIVDGLPVATPARALFDEIQTRGELWGAVQAIDMTAAARLLSVWLFAEFLWSRNGVNGVPLAREAASLAVDDSWSPREPWLRLVCVLLVGLTGLRVNEPVYTLGGRLIGIPDLFDPVAGLPIEYVGEIHLDPAQRAADEVRREAFCRHGLKPVEIVRGVSREEAAGLVAEARARALFAAPAERAWTLERPPWDPAPETLDAYFERTGQVAALTVSGLGPGPSADSPFPGRPPLAGPGRPGDGLSLTERAP